jgi:hypothetical protein
MNQGPLDNHPVDKALMLEEPRPGAGQLNLRAELAPLGSGESASQGPKTGRGKSVSCGLGQKLLAAEEALLQGGGKLLLPRGNGGQTFKIGGRQELPFLIKDVHQFVLPGQKVG